MKFLNWYKEFIVPSALMASLIMGAGMFSLPYIFSASGFWVGISYLIVFGGIASVIHLMYSEVIRHTPGNHRFVGHAKIHLGDLGHIISFLTTLIGIILTLLIYLVLSVKFGKVIFPGANSIHILVVAWIVFSISVISGIDRLAKLDTFITGIKLLIIGGIFVLGFNNFNPAEFSFDASGLLLPYSAVLFALSGRSAISSIHKYLKKNHVSERHLNYALVFGTLTPAFLYMLFVIGVLGISGGAVTEDAISGIASVAPALGLVIAVLGLLSLWTAYTFLGFEAQNILISDFKFHFLASSIAIVAAPLFLYVAGFDNFLALVGLSGGVLFALESTLVILMWQKAMKPKKSLYLASFGIIAVFVLAGFGQLLGLMK